MLKKEVNELLKSYETVHKNTTGSNHKLNGSWEWNKLIENRSKRIHAWKNSRS